MTTRPAFAAPCSNPDGVEGEIVYNTTYKVAQFCNGTHWISMGLNAAPNDNDTLASLGCSSGEIPKWNGTAWACAVDGGSAGAAGDGGQIQFNDGADAFAADANLHWDNVNKRLGIGTATPTTSLHLRNGGVSGKVFTQNTGFIVENNGSQNSWYAMQVSTAGSIDAFSITNSGNVGIGTATPITTLDVVGNIQTTREATYGHLGQYTYSDTAGHYSGVIGYRARGTKASPAHVQSGDNMASFHGRDAINNAWAGMSVTASEAHSSTAGGAQISFHTTLNGTLSSTQKMIIDNAGNVGIGRANPQSKLHVAGGIQLGDDAGACPGTSNAKLGTLRYNSNALSICLTGGWSPVGGGGGGTTFTDGGADSFTTDDIAIGQASAPETSAALEVESTTKGFLPPRMTTAQRNAISNPVEGLIIYNISMQQLQYHNGSAWTAIGAVDSPASTTPLVLSWGYSGTVGTLGNGVATAISAYITPVNSPPSNIVAAYGGGYEYGEQGVLCLRTSSNQIYCWGRGEMIGDGDATDEHQPKLTATAHSWKSVAVGANLSNCAINTSDEAYCWGRQNTNGLGNGLNNSTDVLNPTGPVGGSGTTWLQLAVGGWYDGSNHRQFACGIRLGTSEVQCWGNNNEYQLGNGTTTNNYTTTPTAISGSDTFKFITAGNAFACGINASDKAFCWGRGNEGQQGDGAAADNTVPTAVAGNRSYSMLTAGERFVCGIEIGTQHAYCWGQNDDGQIGNASSGVDITSPVAVIGAKQWKSLAAGRRYVCGIDNTDRIFCWGRGDQGAIGNGELLSVSVPTLIYGEYRFAYIAAGATSMVAITK